MAVGQGHPPLALLPRLRIPICEEMLIEGTCNKEAFQLSMQKCKASLPLLDSKMRLLGYVLYVLLRLKCPLNPRGEALLNPLAGSTQQWHVRRLGRLTLYLFHGLQTLGGTSDWAKARPPTRPAVSVPCRRGSTSCWTPSGRRCSGR